MCRGKNHGGRRCPSSESQTYRDSRAAYQRDRYHARMEIVKRVQHEVPDMPKEEAITYARHVMRIEKRLDSAIKNGQDTETLHSYVSANERGEIREWLPERQEQHDRIINAFIQKYENVPQNRQALMSGGLGGAGKGYVLNAHTPYDTSQYATVNPDDIKEVMAEMDMIPKIDGLSPMEASPLVHEEASYLSKKLANIFMINGTNIIYDITMSSEHSTRAKIAQLQDNGYEVEAIFVDIDPEESIKRAQKRHLTGYLSQQRGEGYGGRWLPSNITENQKITTPVKTYRSINAEVFHSLADEGIFKSHLIYDNNVNGRAPQRMETVKKEEGWD